MIFNLVHSENPSILRDLLCHPRGFLRSHAGYLLPNLGLKDAQMAAGKFPDRKQPWYVPTAYLPGTLLVLSICRN